MGAREGLPGHRLALQRNSRPSARILRAPRLHARENAESLPQTAITSAPRWNTLSQFSLAYKYRNTIRDRCSVTLIAPACWGAWTRQIEDERLREHGWIRKWRNSGRR